MTRSPKKQIVVVSHTRLSMANSALAVAQDSLTADLLCLNGNTRAQLAEGLCRPAAFVVEHEDFAEAVAMVSELRQRYAHQPILVLTEERDEDRLLEAYAAGANECIAATIGSALFVAKMRVWLRWS